MWIFKKIVDLQQYLQQQRNTGASIGFAPTMGALHAGHLSLFEVSRKQNQVTVCSIFVNPTQFNDPKDLEKYPRPIENDLDMLAEVGCDVLFLPDVREVYPMEIYPNGTSKWQCPYDFGNLATVMEGAHRPGHFEGMAQVVERLLDIVQPERLYMGQKDFQQQTIVKSMLQQQRTNTMLQQQRTNTMLQQQRTNTMLQQQRTNTILIRCPIVRERDGLAMSSRNIRLSLDDRLLAPTIYQTLLQAKQDKINGLTPIQIREKAIETLSKYPEFSIDYLEIVNSKTLTSIENWGEPKSQRTNDFKKNTQEIVLCTTVRLGGVRLLDNIIL